MTNKILCLAASTLLLAACGSEGEDRSATVTVDHAAQAQRIAHESIIIDTHIDAPYRLASRPADIRLPSMRLKVSQRRLPKVLSKSSKEWSRRLRKNSR
jgi:hypothetical protein